jgi:hypothetical protein
MNLAYILELVDAEIARLQRARVTLAELIVPKQAWPYQDLLVNAQTQSA